MMASIHTLCPHSQVKLEDVFILWPCDPHNMRSRSERDLLFLCLTKAYYITSFPLPYPNLCIMRAHHRDRQKQTERQGELNRGTADGSIGAVSATLMVPPTVDWRASHDPMYHNPLSPLNSPSLPFQLQEGRLTLKLIKILIQGESVSGIPHNKGKLRPIKTGLKRKRRFGCALYNITIFTLPPRGRADSVTL